MLDSYIKNEEHVLEKLHEHRDIHEKNISIEFLLAAKGVQIF